MTLGQRVAVLRDGRMLQVDSPQTLYAAPVNLFVAGFIGSPSMNFVTARLTRDDGPAVVFGGPAAGSRSRAGGATRPGQVLRERRHPRHAPPDFEDAALADPSWAPMPVHADVTEALGSEVHVIFSIDARAVRQAGLSEATTESEDEAIPLAAGKVQWTARVSARSLVQAGGVAQVAVDTSNLHFFDPADEHALGVVPSAR